MASKRTLFLTLVTTAAVLLAAATAWKLAVWPGRADPRLFRPGPAIDTDRPLPLSEESPPPVRPAVRKKQTPDLEKGRLQSPIAPPSSAVAQPLDSAYFAPEEEFHYFEMMRAGLAEDFPELELSEAEFLALFEAAMQIRRSFEDSRTLARSAENALVFQQLEREREAAIARFERIVGMSFDEFMLHTAVTGGGFEPD